MAHVGPTPATSSWRSTSAHACHAVDEAKAYHQRLLSGPTVEIYVGKERKCWTLHRNLLCHHSSYFETEFQGHEVPRGHDRESLELPDDDPRGFELLVKWLYQGHLEDVSDFTDDERKYDYAVACHKLYVLCDEFDMIQLKNVAMDQYRLGLHEAQLVPDAEEMDEIYRNSPHHSPFRKLMAKIAARQIMDPEVEKDAESYRKCFADNPDFAVEMINTIRAMSGGILFDDPTSPDDDCLYHDHINGFGYHGKEEAKGKVKAITTSACPPQPPMVATRHRSLIQPSPSSSKGSVEPPAERRTPRKLHPSNPPHHPPPTRKPSSLQPQGPQPVSTTPSNEPQDRKPPLTPAPRKLRKTSSQIAHAKSDSTTVSHKNPTKSQPRTRRRNSDASTATPTTASPHSSMLGKRPAAAAIHGRATHKRASVDRDAARTAREGGTGVDGIVRRLDGLGLHGREGGQQQSGKVDEGGKKEGPPKIATRATSFVGMRGMERFGVV